MLRHAAGRAHRAVRDRLGSRALREIDAAPGRYANRSQATTGIITGAIGTAIGLVLLVLLLFVFSASTLYGD